MENSLELLVGSRGCLPSPQTGGLDAPPRALSSGGRVGAAARVWFLDAGSCPSDVNTAPVVFIPVPPQPVCLGAETPD